MEEAALDVEILGLVDVIALCWLRLAGLADLGLRSETERIIREFVHERGKLGGAGL